MSPDTGKLIVCVLVVLYTSMAGMTSIVALDVFNGILITLGVIIAAPLALKGAGGWSGLTETLPAEHFTVAFASILASGTTCATIVTATLPKTAFTLQPSSPAGSNVQEERSPSSSQ